MNLAQQLRSTTQLDPSANALRQGERRVDYLALEMAAQRVATILREQHSVAPGDRVALLLPGTPEFAFAVYGILWAGGVVVPLVPASSSDQLAAALLRSGAKLVIAWHAYAERVDEVSRQLSVDCLFVEPGEFSRILGAVAPRVPLTAVDDDHGAMLVDRPAVDSGRAETLDGVQVGHGELAKRVRIAAEHMAVHPGDVIAAPPSLVDPAVQIEALHAAVVCGAAVLLAGDAGDQGASVRVTGSGRFERVAPITGTTRTAGRA
jgi:long-chain acyl-CoA synthetase